MDRSAVASPSSSPPLPVTAQVPSPTTEVNLHLMQSRALHTVGFITRALNSAEQALFIANEHATYHLICKSHLYRWLCRMKLSRWKDASNDFTRAANVRGWAGKVSDLKLTAERKLLEETKQRTAQTK